MNCNEISNLIEEYIMDELDEVAKEAVKKHLDKCGVCRSEYEETKELIDSIKNMKNNLKVRKDVLNMNKKTIIKGAGYERRSVLRLIPTIAACFFLTVTLLSTSVIVFPSFAATYAPGLPVVKQLVEANTKTEAIQKQVEEIKKENETLKMEIKDIKGTKFTEIQSSTGVSAEENSIIQTMIIDFIKAQFRGDLESIKKMCTDEFVKKIEKTTDGYLVMGKGEAVFSTITYVAKNNGTYYVFVRFNSTENNGEADAQQDFELVKVGDRYLVSFVGIDA